MSIINRVLLLIYTLGVMIALVIIGLAAAGWTTPVDQFRRMLFDPAQRAAMAAVAVVYFVLSVKFFIQSFSTGRYHQVNAVVHETDLGQVRVTAEALENLAQRVVNQIRGVREVRPRVVTAPEGITVLLRVALSPETNIPATSSEIQNNVSNYMAEVAGINIKNVKILVDDIVAEGKTGTARKLM